MKKYIVVETETLRPLDNIGKGDNNLKGALAVYLEHPVGRTILKVIDFLEIKVEEK